MGRRLEAVWPDEVHEVKHRVLASGTGHAKREMLDNRARRLPIDEVPIGECVLQRRHDRVSVVRGLRTDVLEHEGKRLQATGSDVQLSRAVLVQDGRNAGESYRGVS